MGTLPAWALLPRRLGSLGLPVRPGWVPPPSFLSPLRHASYGAPGALSQPCLCFCCFSRTCRCCYALQAARCRPPGLCPSTSPTPTWSSRATSAATRLPRTPSRTWPTPTPPRSWAPSSGSTRPPRYPWCALPGRPLRQAALHAAAPRLLCLLRYSHHAHGPIKHMRPLLPPHSCCSGRRVHASLLLPQLAPALARPTFRHTPRLPDGLVSAGGHPGLPRALPALRPRPARDPLQERLPVSVHQIADVRGCVCVSAHQIAPHVALCALLVQRETSASAAAAPPWPGPPASPHRPVHFFSPCTAATPLRLCSDWLHPLDLACKCLQLRRLHRRAVRVQQPAFQQRHLPHVPLHHGLRHRSGDGSPPAD